MKSFSKKNKRLKWAKAAPDDTAKNNYKQEEHNKVSVESNHRLLKAKIAIHTKRGIEKIMTKKKANVVNGFI